MQIDPSAVKIISDTIARAVSAERERCAKVAEEWPSTFDGMVSPQGRYAAENIAAAIRGGNQ